MLGRLVEVLIRRRLIALIACAFAVAVLGIFAAQVTVDNSLQAWFVEDDPALLAYQSFLDQFGNDELVVTAIHSDEDAYDPARLERLWTLSHNLTGIEGVARVRSLANVESIEGSMIGPAVVPVINPPVRDDDVERAHRLVSAASLASNLVGRDGKTLVLYSWLDAGPNVDTERKRVITEIKSATDSALAPGESASHAGVGVLHEAINEATLSDGARFVALSYLVIAIALYAISRRLAWVMVTLLSVTCADIALLGTMTLTGQSINMVTVALLPLVMILGVENVVHMTTEIDGSLARGRRSLTDLTGCLKEIAAPCVFNTATTAIGLLSLATASMAITRSYGVFGALGVVYAFLFSSVGVAALVPRATRFAPRAGLGHRLGNVVEHMMVFSVRHRALVVAGAVVLALVAVLGVTRIIVDTESIAFLPDDDPARVATYRIEDTVGPFLPLEITVRADSAGSWQHADFLAALGAAQQKLEADPAIGRTASAGDVLRDLEVMVTGEELPRPWEPDDDEDVRNVVDLLERSGHKDELDDWVATDERTLRLTATTQMASAKSFSALAERAKHETQETLGDRADVGLGGYLPLYSQIVVHTLKDLLNSFTIEFPVVFLIVMIMLRSWRYTVAAMPPNLLAVALTLAVMGFTGIRLDIATVTVAGVVMGVIVDDTVHMLYCMRRHVAGGRRFEEAVRDVARECGVAIVSTSAVFCAGFLVISLAASDAVANPGLLIAVAVSLALLGNLLMLPAFASFFFTRIHADDRAIAASALHDRTVLQNPQ